MRQVVRTGRDATTYSGEASVGQVTTHQHATDGELTVIPLLLKGWRGFVRREPLL